MTVKELEHILCFLKVLSFTILKKHFLQLSYHCWNLSSLRNNGYSVINKCLINDKESLIKWFTSLCYVFSGFHLTSKIIRTFKEIRYTISEALLSCLKKINIRILIAKISRSPSLTNLWKIHVNMLSLCYHSLWKIYVHMLSLCWQSLWKVFYTCCACLNTVTEKYMYTYCTCVNQPLKNTCTHVVFVWTRSMKNTST